MADLMNLTEEELAALQEQRATLPRERLEEVCAELFRRNEKLKAELNEEWMRFAGVLRSIRR